MQQILNGLLPVQAIDIMMAWAIVSKAWGWYLQKEAL